MGVTPLRRRPFDAILVFFFCVFATSSLIYEQTGGNQNFAIIRSKGQPFSHASGYAPLPAPQPLRRSCREPRQAAHRSMACPPLGRT